jgi:hypothetical protein
MKRSLEAESDNNMNESVTNNTSAGSVRSSNYCYVFPYTLWSILFLFPSASALQFAVVNKKIKTA